MAETVYTLGGERSREHRGTPLPYLAAWRDFLGMSQRELAKLSGVNHISIARLETRKTDGAYVSTVQKLANALGISPSMLVSRNPNEPRGARRRESGAA